MAKPKYANKRAFSRSTTNEVSKKNMNKRARRNHHEPVPDHPSSSTDSGASVDELSNAASEDEQEEVPVYKEPTMYDNLLKTLGSASESIANAYNRRQRDEEGKSDTDEDIENDVESLSDSEEDEDESENEFESDALDTNDVQGEDEIEDGDGDGDGDEDEDGDGDDDDDDDEDDNDDDDDGEEEVAGNKSEGSSSFSAHLDYRLSEEEVENLPTKKMKYKHRLEAANCKWKATRELNLEDSYSKSPYGLNMKLYDHWLNSYTASGGQDLHSSRQRSFFSLCNSYRDILHHNKKPFYLKGREEDSNIMDAYLLHSLNHIFTTRDLVTKNDKTMAKQKESKGEEVLNSEKFVDQGFTRPKVLIILPFRSIAFRVINRLIQLTPEGHKVNVDHVDRFSDEYGSGQSDDQEDEDVRTKSWKKSKPLDYQALLGANNNDRFMIGIKFTKKTVKLYSDFYTSDMIVASPLGLIDKIETAVVEKEKDVDYLSSIEVLIIDHADVILMQNWDHVPPVIEQLNRIPSKQHGTDIMRIRPWYLDGQARFYRQSIVLASHVHPDINNLFNNYCLNYEGKVNLLREHEGVLPKVLLQVTQIYERIDDTELIAPDARLEYFKKKGGIMILINSVLELVGVRKFLKSQDASFCVCDEDTERPDISRTRAWFFQGKKKIMLYTERAHFYYRYKVSRMDRLFIVCKMGVLGWDELFFFPKYSYPSRWQLYPSRF
ncbi:putative digestive organ expansion factor, predicted [Helianthus anomalus]